MQPHVFEGSACAIAAGAHTPRLQLSEFLSAVAPRRAAAGFSDLASLSHELQGTYLVQ